MPSLRHLLFTFMVVALLTITVVSAAATNRIPENAAPSAEDQQAFVDLLDTVDPAMLHEVLHQHMKEKYQDGVFEDDKRAMVAVHNEEPAVANALVEAAKVNAMIELLKRQASNTTAAAPTSSEASSTSAVQATSTASTTVVTTAATTVITSLSVTTSPTTTPVSDNSYSRDKYYCVHVRDHFSDY
ncbi:vta1 like domain-containing protein [Rutstroemia sp. NJR-2017a BBW]|nr:vta1 like domain-containing protein [Rutstroemia sp. NJR-2017a BBW]